MARRALLWFFRRVVATYFRSVEAAGAAPEPSTGGRLFVSNHVNGLIDPILVLTAAPCAISPVAKSTLWKVPVLKWLLDAVDAVPIVRRRDDPGKAAGSNDEAFTRVASWLRAGGNILIFPEGTSHNEPHVLEVRSGAARMLARAYREGAAGATFQAVALEFDARDKFRSRCLLVYGPVRAVAPLVASGEDDDALVRAINQHVQDDLSELLVEGASWPERRLIARVAEMLANDGGDGSLARWNEIGRQVEAARKALRGSEARVETIESAVSAYYALLDREGLKDEQLVAQQEPPPAELMSRVVLLSLLAPLALCGALLYWLPYQAPRLARSKAGTADEVSTYKLGAGLCVYPLWAAALCALAFWRLPLPSASAACAIALASPFAALVATDLSRPLRRTLALANRRTRLDAARTARARALELVRETQAELGM